MNFVNKVANTLSHIEIQGLGKANKDLVLLATKVKLDSLETDPNDLGTEIFKFYPHRVEKVLYLRDIEDGAGNGIVFFYNDPNQGFHKEVVYADDTTYKKLCSRVNATKDVNEYKRLLTAFVLLMSKDDYTLSLIESSKVIIDEY